MKSNLDKGSILTFDDMIALAGIGTINFKSDSAGC